jgi:hypothetical protein
MDALVRGCVKAPTINYAITHGLLLLSRYPLTNKTAYSFHSYRKLVLARGYLAARIDQLGSVVCADFSTELPIYCMYKASSISLTI